MTDEIAGIIFYTMNARAEAQLNMLKTTSTYVTENGADAAADKPVLGTYNDELTFLINITINPLLTQTESSTVGITANKLEKRREMEAMSASVAAILFAFANDESNTELAEQVKPWKRKSAYVSLKDSDTYTQALIIYNLAVGISPATDLVQYGWVLPAVGPPIVLGTAVTFSNILAAYLFTIERPELAIEERKGANVDLADYFKTANDLVRKMDDVLYDYQFLPNTDDLKIFWNGYKAARTIFDEITTHTKIRGVAKDSVTELPIQGVKVTAVSSQGEIIDSFTAETGNYTVYTPKFKDNPYSLTFTKAGYQTKQFPEIFVKRGKITNRDVSMIPLP